jgi:hypothetical protein
MLPGNRLLYQDDGLRLIRAALDPAGRLVVWSADRSPRFEQRLQALDLQWDAVDVAARGAPDDPMHTVYLVWEEGHPLRAHHSLRYQANGRA